MKYTVQGIDMMIRYLQYYMMAEDRFDSFDKIEFRNITPMSQIF